MKDFSLLSKIEVSIIIPTYKPGSYLFDCLQSVINQDFPKSKFEIVVVLNGTENTYLPEIESFIENKKVNYRLLYTPQKGVSNARNLALDSVDSKFIVFLDDDDMLSSNFISSLYSSIYLNTIVVSNVKTFITNINILGDDYITKCYIKCYDRPKFSLFRYRGFLSSVCAKMIPRNVIGEFRFDRNLHYGEDAVFMFTISCNIWNIKLDEDNAIYFRRLRQGSSSRMKLTLWTGTRNMLINLFKYSVIYFSAIKKYNFLLYLSRLAATLKYYSMGLFLN